MVDDIRPPPEGWTRVYWPEEAIGLLRGGEVVEISLDHDLGDDVRTGYDVLLWIEEQVATAGFRSPRIAIHSANAGARGRMLAAVRSIERYATPPSDVTGSR